MKNNYFAAQDLVVSRKAARLIRSLRILLVGVGAGGNEVLKDLVLEGFGDGRYGGCITVVDFDRVEDSNLSKSVLFTKGDPGRCKAEVAARRAAAMALADEPDIRFINADIMTLGKGIFLEHDFVIICVDKQKARAYINDLCVLTRTPFMELGFRSYNAEVSFFAPVGPMRQADGAIIDSLPSSDGVFPRMLGEFPVCLREEIGTGSFDDRRNSCSGFKVRDRELEKIPTIQSSAALTAALLTQELVKYLDGKDTLRNKMLLCYGLPLDFLKIEYSRNPACTVHDRAFDPITVPVPQGATARAALEAVRQKLGGTPLLTLPDDFIVSATCHCCGKRIPIGARAGMVWDEQRWCEECREAYPDYATRLNYPEGLVRIPRELSLSSPAQYLDMPLNEIGVPDNDILECAVLSDGGPEYYDIYLKTE